MDLATERIKNHFVKSIGEGNFKSRLGEYKINKIEDCGVEIIYTSGANTGLTEWLKSYDDFNGSQIVHDNIIIEEGFFIERVRDKRKRSVQYDLFRDYKENNDFDVNTITGFKKEFLHEFTKIDQKSMDRFVSLYMDVKKNLYGTGASSGKGFEENLSTLVELYTGFHACKLDLVNKKNLTADILVSKSPKIKNFNLINASLREDGTINCKKLYKLLDNNPFLEISLKQYENNECQITTQYDIKELCDNFIEKNQFCDDLEVIDLIVNELDKITDGNKIVMSCQNYPKSNVYRFYVYEGFSRIEGIKHTKKTKHYRFEFISNGAVVAHFKYGGKQANAFQRGLWVNDFDFFTCIYEGNYKNTTEASDFFNKGFKKLLIERIN